MQFILAYISGIFNVQKSITVLLTSIYEENFKKAYTNEKSRDTIPSLTVKKIKHRWNPYSIKVSQRCCFVFKYSLFSLLGHG